MPAGEKKQQKTHMSTHITVTHPHKHTHTHLHPRVGCIDHFLHSSTEWQSDISETITVLTANFGKGSATHTHTHTHTHPGLSSRLVGCTHTNTNTTVPEWQAQLVTCCDEQKHTHTHSNGLRSPLETALEH